MNDQFEHIELLRKWEIVFEVESKNIEQMID